MIIQEFDLFRDIANEVVEELISVMEDVSYNSGEVVFSEGDPADNLYVLQSGALDLFMAGTSQATCVAIKAGEAVGWSSLAGRKTYSATVQCAEASRLYKIDKNKLDNILRQYPSTGLGFYKKLAGLVGERVIKCYQEIAKIREES
ncbi:MAG: cyclic nucleotide-binding domain-containing protein [Desulfobacterales bacterium]|jgi:CRP-like cAMP-binding protein